MHYAVYLRKIKNLNSLTEVFWAVTQVINASLAETKAVYLPSNIYKFSCILMKLLGSQILIILVPHNRYVQPKFHKYALKQEIIWSIISYQVSMVTPRL